MGRESPKVLAASRSCTGFVPPPQPPFARLWEHPVALPVCSLQEMLSMQRCAAAVTSRPLGPRDSRVAASGSARLRDPEQASARFVTAGRAKGSLC